MTSANKSARLFPKPFSLYTWGGKLWDHIGKFGADLYAHPTLISKSDPGNWALYFPVVLGALVANYGKQNGACIVLRVIAPSDRVEKCIVIGSYLVSASC